MLELPLGLLYRLVPCQGLLCAYKNPTHADQSTVTASIEGGDLATLPQANLTIDGPAPHTGIKLNHWKYLKSYTLFALWLWLPSKILVSLFCFCHISSQREPCLHSFTQLYGLLSLAENIWAPLMEKKDLNINLSYTTCTLSICYNFDIYWIKAEQLYSSAHACTGKLEVEVLLRKSAWTQSHKFVMAVLAAEATLSVDHNRVDMKSRARMTE